MSYLHYLCLFMAVYNTYCVVVVFFCFTSLRFVYPMLPVSIDCPFIITSSVSSHIYLYVHVFSVYPHKSMGFVIDQSEVYSIQLYVIILLNVVLDTNNIAILVERSYLRHLRLLAFQDNLSPQCHTDMVSH